jgi:pyruvate kinase
MLVLTPSHNTARRSALLWGAHAVHTATSAFEEMIAKGKRMALRHGFGVAGSKLVALAGVPRHAGCDEPSSCCHLARQ